MPHDVTNQAEPLSGHNVYTTDRALQSAVAVFDGAFAESGLQKIGEAAGSPLLQSWGTQANANPPVLKTHDRFGHRIDEVEFHPAYHELMSVSVSHGLHSTPWTDPRPGAHVARAAATYLMSQVEAGHICPISMTYSAVPALRTTPELSAVWEPRLTSTNYDPRPVTASEKTGALCGMAMTEKQGGSDVRANTTTAQPVADGWVVTGHKWFCSAPMCDAFLVLAQTSDGLSCFLLPRWLPDGTTNAMRIQRLKDKLGNRSNASSEVEYDRAWVQMVGEPGRGVPTIIEMVNHTRLDCVIGSAAGMRAGVAQAVHHASQRSAFGKLLIEQPLMTNVLADLAVESEAATVTAMRLARAYDSDDQAEVSFRRLATAVSKYWVCKRLPVHAAEALECLGGNGYVEESGLPRLFRESPLNSIWEGSGNVICLDVLRAMSRNPDSVDAFFDELNLGADADSRVANAVKSLKDTIATADESQARHTVEAMAIALQASLLVRYADPAVSDAFCSSRLDGEGGRAFGTLGPDLNFKAIVDRAVPA